MTRRGWLLFWTLGVIWGLPYLLIKVAVDAGMHPTVLVCTRVALAAALLLPLAAVRGWLRPLLPHWRWLAVFAAVEIAAPFGMLTLAETRLTSSLTGLLVATVPMFAALLAWTLRLDDKPSGLRLAGLAVGLAGVACLVGIDVRGSDLFSAGLVVLSALCYALGPVIVTTRLVGLSSIAVSGAAMALTAVAYAPFALASWPSGGSGLGGSGLGGSGLGWTPWGAVVVLGSVCSALAFVWLFALIDEVGPARTTVITYVNPAVALLLGVLVLSEPVTVGLLVGFPLVILGSWLATRRATASRADVAAT